MNPSSSLALERLRSESLVRTRSQVKTELSRAASVIDDGIFCLERMRSRGSVSCALRSEDSDTPGTRRSPRLLERVVSRGLSNSLLERAGSEVPVISSGSALPSLLQPMSSEVSLQASMSGQAFDDLDNAMGPIELAKKLGKQSASEVQPPTVEQSSAAGARAETASFLVDTATLHLSKPPDSEYFCLKNKKRKKPSGPALGIRKIANHFHEDTSSYKAFINEPCKNCGAVEFDDTKPGTRTCMRCRFQMETCTNCSAADFFVDEKAGTRTCRRCGVQIEERIERDLYKGQGKVLDYHRATIPDDEEPDNIFIEALACSKGRAKTLRNSLRNTRDKLHSVANAMDLDEELAGHVVRTAMKYFKMLLKKDINFKGKNMNAVHAALFWYALLMCDSYRHNPPKRAYKAVRIPANKALPQSDRFQPIKDSELRKFAEWLQKSTAAGGAGLPKLPASSRPVPQQLVEDLLLRLKGPDVHEDLRLDDKTFRLALRCERCIDRMASFSSER
eukprot:SAG31_NODE_205_length_20397_cov_19.191152_8_plen_505_part_00